MKPSDIVEEALTSNAYPELSQHMCSVILLIEDEDLEPVKEQTLELIEHMLHKMGNDSSFPTLRSTLWKTKGFSTVITQEYLTQFWVWVVFDWKRKGL